MHLKFRHERWKMSFQKLVWQRCQGEKASGVYIFQQYQWMEKSVALGDGFGI